MKRLITLGEEGDEIQFDTEALIAIRFANDGSALHLSGGQSLPLSPRQAGDLRSYLDKAIAKKELMIGLGY
jgi:hypothetical protein